MMTAVKPVTLAEDTISQGELEQTAAWMLAGNRLTKAELTTTFEEEFAAWMGCKHAVFVNSGSSANLLMIYAAQEAGRLRNTKVIAPAVSWVTTVSPLIQLGFEVRLCDCDPINLGLDLDHLEQLCRDEAPSMLILVHVLGHANHMREIRAICERYDVLLLEDSCEALGSTFEDRKLGCHGAAGSFSFYYGHHISTIEGGMVVTDDSELHQVMLSLRSHGWSRDLDPARRDSLQQEHGIDDFRNFYTFYHAGFNLRSTDLQAFIGRLQITKLDEICAVRQRNFDSYAAQLPEFFCQKSDAGLLSSFAYGTLVENRMEVYAHLKAQQIECRPLICGNIARHPFWTRRYGEQVLPNADLIHEFGIYLPNHHNLRTADVERVTSAFNSVARPKGMRDRAA
ncbi:DegT/DnrJ/EryC1/StrS family aminotransferase [Tritonibacter horizontis]|uniref:UDP-4-amino-4, 6-dideoxy-N-acetyl-beta-L-altrosamine transaminase n=1 Tax=Tritonibacter horizontis TaxID=1768241 RepID=A0A132BYQ6_9RHOB|nr:DegT/DnrJ/EryC1/StrS family aminotransferase [Tritonibacter horizontis]KUP93434.1 UDP-4-amino-4,6-dideoxy-N-acetyl-beta-L-altrosamine transaminase [Tritonibacter horizontis]